MSRSIGRNEIREELGRGGMAIVYLVFDSRLDRQVVFKLLDQQISADSAFATRFELEAKSVAVLEHSAIDALNNCEVRVTDQAYLCIWEHAWLYGAQGQQEKAVADI